MTRKKVTLIAEGGGQLGIFTAGVLDSFSHHDFDRFDAFIGVSAGTHNLTSYLCGRVGYGKKVIEELTTDKPFISITRLLLGGHLIDLDWYFQTLETHPDFMLDIDAIPSRLRERDVIFCATNWQDGSPRYLKPSTKSWFQCAKASSAIPYLYRKGVVFGDECLVDGGLSDPLPVVKAYEEGATDLVVIRTGPNGCPSTFDWVRYLEKFVSAERPWWNQLLNVQVAYARAVSFINSPPEGVTVALICPPTRLGCRVLFSSKAAMAADYQQGYRAGLNYLYQTGHLRAPADRLSA
jgi:predicted patatin/cPLA2 family phospholipase